ncbi:hypothetical protein BASA84_000544 [Batrachochytrium salamandrivorans]|nr:hypothetical protein BASA84_000544 [Batrachochytrium salamandrivorans]
MGRVTYRLETVKRHIQLDDKETDLHDGVSIPHMLRAISLKLAQAKAVKDRRAVLKYLEELSTLFARTEDWAQSAKYSKDVLELAHALKEPLKEANAYQQLALASSKMDMFEEAISYAEGWLRKSREAKSTVDEVEALLDLAVYHINQGENLGDDSVPRHLHFDHAESYLRATAEIIKRPSCSIDTEQRMRARGMIAMNLGIVYKSKGIPDKGIAAIQRALQIFSKTADIQQQANAFFNLATCFDAKFDYVQALKFGKQEQSLFHSLGDVNGELKSIWDNCYRLRRLGRFVERRIDLERYKDICKRHGYTEELLRCESELDVAVEDIERSKKIVSLSATIDDAVAKSESRKQLNAMAERANIFIELDLFSDAISDLKAQLVLALTLKESNIYINKIRESLGNAHFELNEWEAAQGYFRDYLKYDDTSSCSADRLVVMWKLVQAMSNGGSTFQTLRKLHNDTHELSIRLKNVDIQLCVLKSWRNLCRRFDFVDQVDLITAQIDYLLANKSKQDTYSSSLSDDIGSHDSEDLEADESSNIGTIEAVRVDSHTPERHPTASTLSARNPFGRHFQTLHSKSITNGITDLNSSPIDLTLAPTYNLSNQGVSDDDVSDQSETIQFPKKRRVRGRIFVESLSEISDGCSEGSRGANHHQGTLQDTPLSCGSPIASSKWLRVPNSPGALANSSAAALTCDMTRKDSSAFTIAPAVAATLNTGLLKEGSSTLEDAHSSGTTVQVEFLQSNHKKRILEIDCTSGPSGTPKTVGWVMAEARRRYLAIFNSPPPKFQLETQAGANTPKRILSERDIVLEVSDARPPRLCATPCQN